MLVGCDVVQPDALPVQWCLHACAACACSQVDLPATAGRRCSKCNNMRPLSYFASEDSTCNWHVMQRSLGGGARKT
jgi:hypothetical protein